MYAFRYLNEQDRARVRQPDQTSQSRPDVSNCPPPSYRPAGTNSR